MKKALVIGYGVSGKGAEKLLCQLNYQVEIVEQLLEIPEGNFDFAILSPGIPQTHPILKAIRERKIPLIGETEFALRHLNNICIGVTGTNGKTTLTEFLAHVLKGKAVGNVGESLSAYAAGANKKETLVIELSSFQLETLEIKALDYAIITNITPDHLDRYLSFEAYAKTKWQIIKNLKEGGICFIPKGLEKQGKLPIEIINENSYLQLTLKERYWKKLDHIALALAFTVCQKFKVSEEIFLRALETFKKKAHRLEYVCEIDGVTFINDSKSTNPAATLYAVRQVPKSTLLIVGGESKELTFDVWKEGLGEKIKAVFTIGKSGTKLKKMLDPFYQVHQKATLEEATNCAYQMAQVGDTVLFSPGCASFDQFKNYMHRGEIFKNSIQQLRRGK